MLMWLVLGVGFLFIFLDFNLFNNFKQNFRELDYAVHSDPVAGIANRYSSDMIIEKYLDKPLPASLGCVMVELSSLNDINRLFGHVKGNDQIKEFSDILRRTSAGLCHVSRNGGNRFLAIFEDCTEDKIKEFLMKTNRSVTTNNNKPDALPIVYKYGIAFHEPSATTITQLIALASKRIDDK